MLLEPFKKSIIKELYTIFFVSPKELKSIFSVSFELDLIIVLQFPIIFQIFFQEHHYTLLLFSSITFNTVKERYLKVGKVIKKDFRSLVYIIEISKCVQALCLNILGEFLGEMRPIGEFRSEKML